MLTVKIQGLRGGKPYSKTVANTIAHAVNVMSRKLALNYHQGVLNIRLGRVTNKWIDGDAQGTCIGEFKNGQWTIDIVLARRKRFGLMLRTLAHEMIHAKQYLKRDISTIRGFDAWRGKIWRIRKKADPYRDSPWEREAFSKELALARYCKKQMGLENEDLSI
jgi:hypothetical protein